MVFPVLGVAANAQTYGERRDTTVIEKQAELQEIRVVSYRRVEQGDAKRTVLQINRKLPINTHAEVALRQLPGIVSSDEGYKMVGSERVCKLYIDGVDATKEEVDRLLAKEIDHVELIHSSIESNDYDGEINIVKRKSSHRMIYGELNSSVGALGKNVEFSSSLSYHDKRLDMAVSGQTSNYSYGNEMKMLRTWVSGVSQSYDSNGETNVNQKYLNLRASYLFTSKVSATMAYLSMKHDIDIQNNTRNLDGGFGHLSRKEEIDNHFVNAVVRMEKTRRSRLFVKGKFFDYSNENDVVNLPGTHFLSKMQEWTVEALGEHDSLRLFGANHGACIGFRAIYRKNTPSGTSAEEMTGSTTERTQLSNNIYIGYMNDLIQLSSRLSINCQFRMEWAEYHLYSSKRVANAFLPHLTVNYKLQHGRLMLTGERYVTRPSIDMLNSDVFYSNEVSQLYGNNNLHEFYNNRLQLRYSHQMGATLLTFTGAYRYAAEMIGSLYNDDLNSFCYHNAGYGNITNLSVSCALPLLSHRLNLNVSANAWYYDYRLSSALKPLTQSTGSAGWGFGTVANLSFISSQEWMFNALLSVIPTNRDFSSVISRRPSLELSVEKAFFGDKLTLSLSAMEVLGTKSFSKFCFRSASEQLDSTIRMSNIVLSATWNFGKTFSSRNTGTFISNDDISTKQ